MFDRVYVVSTPENLTLRFERAGLVTRAVALAIDVLVMAALVRATALLLSPFEQFASATASALWIVTGFVVQWWYGALCEWRAGRTLGKWLLGIRVVNRAGLPLGLPQALLRNLLRLLDLLPGFHLVGALACLVDPAGRRLGDLAAQTLVVRTTRPFTRASRRHDLPAFDASLDAFAAQLNEDERQVVLALDDASDALPAAERVALYVALDDHLRARHAALVPDFGGGERTLRQLAGLLRAARDQES